MSAISVIYLAASLILGTFAHANEILFSPAIYEAGYQEGLGRAWIRMTSNPGLVLISTDQNRCTPQACLQSTFADDLNDVPFRLERAGEKESNAIYKAVREPLSSFGRQFFSENYEKQLDTIRVAVVADTSGRDFHSAITLGDKTFYQPSTLTLLIQSPNRQRHYQLKLVGYSH